MYKYIVDYYFEIKKTLRNMEVLPWKFASDLLKRNKDIAGKNTSHDFQKFNDCHAI